MNTNNTKYTIAKEMVTEYIDKMDSLYEDKLKQIEDYKTNVIDEFDEYFDYYKALKFVRTWDIIKNNLNPAEKNLVIASECAKDYEECLSFFNGGKAPKNIATLRVLICNARKKIREIYNQKWGDCVC